MARTLLTLNAGSSSMKFGLFSANDDEPRLIAKGQVEGIATHAHFVAKSAEGHPLTEAFWQVSTAGSGHDIAFQKIWAWLAERQGTNDIIAVGHRIAHGGATYTEPVVINEEVIRELTRLVPLVPLHQPHNLAAVKSVSLGLPELPQVACFDTGFHRNRPQVSECFALPYELHEKGIRRYGFHGLSYEFIVDRLSELAPSFAQKRIVVAHLGSGCSMTAIYEGRSIETTMSFSSLDGVPMGTRCGTLDPGVLLYLMKEEGFDAAALEDLLYRRSGLLGLSGVSNDMRELHSSGVPGARRAIDYFVYRVGQHLGALCSTLGGIDALVFTAGIGENDAELRKRICGAGEWLGIDIDPTANSANALEISSPQSRVAVWVIPTDEEMMIARHTLRLVGDSKLCPSMVSAHHSVRH